MNGQVQRNRRPYGPSFSNQPAKHAKRHQLADERQLLFMYRWIQRTQIDRILTGPNQRSRD